MKKTTTLSLGELRKETKIQLAKVLAGETITVSSAFDPAAKPDEGDEVLGVLQSPQTRNIWQLSSRLNKAARELSEAPISGDGDAFEWIKQNAERRKELGMAQDLATALRKLFWLGVKEEFPRASVQNAGIRAGWEVTVEKAKAVEGGCGKPDCINCSGVLQSVLAGELGPEALPPELAERIREMPPAVVQIMATALEAFGEGHGDPLSALESLLGEGMPSGIHVVEVTGMGAGGLSDLLSRLRPGRSRRGE